MYSVTKRISMVKQPYGGYLNKKQFDITSIDDGKTLNEAENIHASLIGLAVDYLTRFMMGTSVEEAFKISLQGALCLDLFLNNASGKKGLALGNAKKLLKGIKGLDNESVSNACKLVGYDVCFRAGVIGYKPVEEIKPDRGRSLYEQMLIEQNAIKELLLYIYKNQRDSGVFRLLNHMESLEMDDTLINDYLADLFEGKVNDWLIDYVDDMYEEIGDIQKIKERKKLLSLFGDRSVCFDFEDLEDGENES